MSVGLLIPKLPPLASTTSSVSALFNAMSAAFGQKTGIPMWDQAFKFDYAGEIQYTGNAEISDHVMEDASTIQDHVVIKPVKFALHGFVGLVAMNRNQIQQGVLGTVQALLGQIPAYAGRYTPGAAATISSAISKAQSVTRRIQDAVAQGKAIQAMALGSAPQMNKIQDAFFALEALKDTATPFSLKVPFRFKPYDNMLIESLVAVEDDKTHTVVDFAVTVKQVRTVSSLLTLSTAEVEAQRQAIQALGITQGTAVDSPSLLSRLGKLVGVS